MPLWERVKEFLGVESEPTPAQRTLSADNTPAVLGQGYGGSAAARINRLTLDFIGRNSSADQDLFSDNKRLRARARLLALDNPFARKFIQMCRQNVIGQSGIMVKSTVTNAHGKETADTDRINLRIDEEWNKWCKRGRCTADGKFSFADVQLLVIGNIAREGENLLKKVYGRQFNESGFALQFLDNDQLDDSMMMALGNGSAVRMGVEVDPYRKPVAYHLWSGHPNDILGGNRERKRVPASDIIHTAVWERPGQTRGYTWMIASIIAMNQYGRYEEAVIVAARASAAKYATIETAYPTDGSMGFEDEDDDGDDTNVDGTKFMSGNAGEIETLDIGQTLNFTDPRFPTTTHKDFTQTMLRNVASGLLVMYPSLANDLEGVNFSSIRAGLIDERDMWRMVQRFFTDSFIADVRSSWLRMALLTTLQDITLTPDQMEQYSARARGWEWVDPQKDANASILELGEGFTTLEIKCAQKGLDWQEVAKQRKREQDYLAKLGVVYGVDITGDQGGKGVAAGDESQVTKEGGAAKSRQIQRVSREDSR